MSVVNAFFQGRQVAQQEYDDRQRNALIDQQMQTSARRNALAEQEAKRQLSREEAAMVHAKLSQAVASGNARQFVSQYIPDLAASLKQQNIDLSAMDDESANGLISNLARKYAGEAGIAPQAAPAMTPYQQAQIDLEREKMNQPKSMSPYEQARIDIERQKLNRPEPPKPQYTTLTPEEVRAAGLPDGTAAQRSPDGKIEVLSKRDNTGALSQKDATTAKMKLTTVSLARKQLENIKAKFKAGREGLGPNAFGPGQGLLPTEKGKQFDAAVDQMRSTLTALTRVPGVGAMSDYETKLDQAKFPERNAWESVTEEKIRGIEDMLALIENGYKDLLGGGQAQSQEQQAPAQQPATRGISPEEAAKLPPGTRFIGLDGVERVKN